MSEMTPEQKNELYQKIWSLRNVMSEQLDRLQLIHDVPFPTKKEGISALYAVHDAWNSNEYNDLEKFIKEME